MNKSKLFLILFISFIFMGSSSAELNCVDLFVITRADANAENFYVRLGVESGATQEQIKDAYRIATKVYHPNSGNPLSSSAAFLQISKAYDTLKNPALRLIYDREHPRVEAATATVRSASPKASQPTPYFSTEINFTALLENYPKLTQADLGPLASSYEKIMSSKSNEEFADRISDYLLETSVGWEYVRGIVLNLVADRIFKTQDMSKDDLLKLVAVSKARWFTFENGNIFTGVAIEKYLYKLTKETVVERSETELTFLFKEYYRYLLKENSFESDLIPKYVRTRIESYFRREFVYSGVMNEVDFVEIQATARQAVIRKNFGIQ